MVEQISGEAELCGGQRRGFEFFPEWSEGDGPGELVELVRDPA
jgi:hypothetical protein